MCNTAIWEACYLTFILQSCMYSLFTWSCFQVLSHISDSQSGSMRPGWVGVRGTPECRLYWDSASCLHWACLWPAAHWALLALHSRKMTEETYEQSVSQRHKAIIKRLTVGYLGNKEPYSEKERSHHWHALSAWHSVGPVSLWPIIKYLQQRVLWHDMTL